MANEQELAADGNDPARVPGCDGGPAAAGPPSDVPEPAGPPQPLAEKPAAGCGCTGTVIALLLAGGAGLLLLPDVLMTRTSGATRSARLERENRAVQIARALADAHPAAEAAPHRTANESGQQQ
jgi:hypothetical protein